MAREIRIERVQRRRVRRAEPVAPIERAEPVPPASIPEARQAIEETRGRIAATLDSIEDRLDTKKEELRERLNFLQPVRSRIRQHHWRSLGVAFGAGLLLGLVTGGGEAEEHRAEAGLSEEERKDLRRWRVERRARLDQAEARRRLRASESRRGRQRQGTAFGLGTATRALVAAAAAGIGDRARSAMR